LDYFIANESELAANCGFGLAFAFGLLPLILLLFLVLPLGLVFGFANY